jgi:hypothetical protein
LLPNLPKGKQVELHVANCQIDPGCRHLKLLFRDPGRHLHTPLIYAWTGPRLRDISEATISNTMTVKMTHVVKYAMCSVTLLNTSVEKKVAITMTAELTHIVEKFLRSMFVEMTTAGMSTTIESEMLSTTVAEMMNASTRMKDAAANTICEDTH